MKVEKRLKLKKSVVYKCLITIFVIVMLLLFYASFFIYSNNRKVLYYDKSNKYSYIIINKMSDKFATMGNRELHFVKDKNKNVYVVLIDSKKINKYKDIIDYTYGKNNKEKSIKLYVYPIKYTDDIKKLALKYVNKFLPYEEKINVEKDTFDEYLGKYYLDTGVKTTYKFNYIVFVLFLLVILFISLIVKYTIKSKKNRHKEDKK